LRAIALVALAFALIVACARDEPPTPTPSGPGENEIAIPGAVVLIGAGDIGVCGTSGDEATGAIVDSIIRADSVAGIQTAVFTAGDNAYPSEFAGTVRYFQRCLAGSWGKPRILKVIHPALGNHDYDSGSADPYFDFFGEKAGPRGKGYYSYNLGGWHAVALNSELFAGAGSSAEVKAQENWLRADLAANPTRCTLAYFHRPLFSSGTYGSTPEPRALWQILYDAGVDLVLNGHEHDYERFQPQTPRGAVDPAKGIEQIVVGTGGGVLRNIMTPLALNSAYQIHGHFGVLKLQLGDSVYSRAFIDTNGRVWDSGSGTCH
jgi:hypothetical protein